jgi:hypothetical protein
LLALPLSKVKDVICKRLKALSILERLKATECPSAAANFRVLSVLAKALSTALRR